MDQNKNYLFIGGVGRSGTSSLTEIIGSHPHIILGLERYNKLFRKLDFSINPSHFEKERFLNIQPGDTFYANFNKFRLHEKIPKKWDKAVYVGVKYPRITMVYNETKQALGDFKVIYIYRNIFDVTESSNRRLNKKTRWPMNRDHKKMVSFWNRSMLITRELIESNKNIICVKYKDMFFTEKSIKPVFDWLGLDVDDTVRYKLIHKRKLAPKKLAKKGKLSDELKQYIKQNANFDLYEEFNRSLNIL